MAEPIAVEFELTPDVLARLYAPPQQRIGAFAMGGLFLALGLAVFILAATGADKVGALLGPVLILFGALAVLGAVKMPRSVQNLTARLAGPTKILLSDRGVEYSGVNAAERVEWSRMMRVLDRPNTWVLMTKAPVTTYYIPKFAVPPEQQERFVAQLMDWSGGAYKFRKR